MFKRVLIPIDLGERCRGAVLAAPDLASGGQVTLLHVIETIQGAAFEEFEDFYRSLAERAEAALERWSAELSGSGLRIERQIVYGKRAEEIVRFAEAHKSDLILLASHQVSAGLPGAQLGTLSHQVALFATCPVLLLR